MMKRDEATLRQIEAAIPTANTWLSANAGSGKTRVLTDRVARLLLEGVEPQHILCLTYTKAAATEMQNRLFKRLGAWAMLSNTELRKELFTLGLDREIDQLTLRDARTLFARAIETPGGLKIQTIHSFCASILRRFPLEAGVSPQFVEMEDRAAIMLREEIVDDMADGQDRDVVLAAARYLGAENFSDLTAEIVKHRTGFSKEIDREAVFAMFDLPLDTTEESISGKVFLGGEGDLVNRLIAALRTGGVNDNKAADKLVAMGLPGYQALPVLESTFLTGASAKSPFSAKIGSFPTKGVQKAHADLMPHVEALMLRVEDQRRIRLALAAARKTEALHNFARVFLEAYDRRKTLIGALDFDDLILKARDLLTDPLVAAWVLYRLDGGIDHILVDEAQDTSPVQWSVIENLAQEFTSGSGSRSDTPRTIFVVGDKKQSIYSFQGADPAEFDRMKEEFGGRLEGSENPLHPLELEYSFRSSTAVLHLVDQTFESDAAPGLPVEMKHRAFKTDMPGRVDLWPVIDKVEAPDKPVWYDPVDQLQDTHHAVQLADRIAEEIDRMIRQQVTIPEEIDHSGKYFARPVSAGDFLILVQRRSDLFDEIIRACKQRGLPIAGADRLKVGGELAVRDLAALLSFLATPEDDLSLATVLRSPLFGFSEQQLYELAQGRGPVYLWQVLRKEEEKHPDVLAVLEDLQQQADFLRPYDLIERILTRHDGRRKLLARLGAEAEDGINALLSQALAYERNAVPSLTGFLVWMETDDLEIKRQMDSGGDQIRVMTVHGAKGLESRIVILPDTGKRDIRITDQIVDTAEGLAWTVTKDDAPEVLQQARLEKIERQREERLRLLYVAMTRAEKWLIVAAAGDLGKDGASWYDTIRQGMQTTGATPHEFGFGQGSRFEYGDWEGLEVRETSETGLETVELPAFFHHAVPDYAPPLETLSPSDLGGAKALPGEEGLDEEEAKRRGSQIHQLLEHLPKHDPADWHRLAPALLEQSGLKAEGSAIDALLQEAAQILQHPDLAALFTPETLAEVPVTAHLDLLARRIHGSIDRLIVTPEKVLAVDFKTNARVPESVAQCPEGLLRQMGAYAHALKAIYPGREIETAILWTRTATLQYLPHDLVTDALSRATYLDASGQAP